MSEIISKDEIKKINNNKAVKKFYEKLNENPEKKYKICNECHQKYYYSNYSKHLKSKKHNIICDALKINQNNQMNHI